MPRSELKKMMCKDLTILKIGKKQKNADRTYLFTHAEKCTTFKIALFEQVTGLEFKNAHKKWPFQVFECMEEELDYEHDVWWSSRVEEFELLLPIENQKLVDWIEAYCHRSGLTFRKLKWANLHIFKYRHKPWIREKTVEIQGLIGTIQERMIGNLPLHLL